jgi:hypothetical protein
MAMRPFVGRVQVRVLPEPFSMRKQQGDAVPMFVSGDAPVNALRLSAEAGKSEQAS